VRVNWIFAFARRSRRRNHRHTEREKRENPFGNGTPTRWFDSECFTSVPPRPRVPQLALLGNKTLVCVFET